MKMKRLLRDADYRRYFLRSPRFPYPLATPTPWKLWIHRESTKRPGKLVWVGKEFESFKEAFNYSKERMSGWEDFSITSQVIGFVPPVKLRNNYAEFDWCYRCRRPAEFRPYERHHALRKELHEYYTEWPVCPFCGAREGTQITLVPG